jgi:formate/nitrite transporter FocA (FNT family)
MVEPELHESLRQLASTATSGGFGHVLYGGVYAGWLIALLAWLLASTSYTGAQIAFIWLCTAPIHALGFKHSIAGSVEAFYLAAGGAARWTDMLASFVVPSVIGNTIGGVLLVALLNYGQVASERSNAEGPEG